MGDRRRHRLSPAVQGRHEGRRSRAGTELMPGAPVEALRRVPLFANLDDEELGQVALLFKERHFAAGQTVVKEGSEGAAFFLIDSGEATVAFRGSQRTA